jgi:hypothetical protein
MKKIIPTQTNRMSHDSQRFDVSVENFKRRRALPLSSSVLDLNSRLFFEKILCVKKIRELIFITKEKGKRR